MKILSLALLAILTSTPMAYAQPESFRGPEMVTLPRSVAEAVMQWIAQPNAGNAVQIFATLQACIADNPENGALRRMEPDQCPVVTAAITQEQTDATDAAKWRAEHSEKKALEAKKPDAAPAKP